MRAPDVPTWPGARAPEVGRVLLLGLLVIGLVAATGSPAQGRAAPADGRVAPQMQVRPTSGPAGITVGVRARGLPLHGIICGTRTLVFVDANGADTTLKNLSPQLSRWKTTATVPNTAAMGLGQFQVVQ